MNLDLIIPCAVCFLLGSLLGGLFMAFMIGAHNTNYEIEDKYQAEWLRQEAIKRELDKECGND